MRALTLFTGLALLIASPTMTPAAEPTLTHLHPAGLQSGTTTKVKLTGKFKPWPCKIWTDAAGLVFTPGKDEGHFEVAVAATVPPGPHLFRAFNDDGASAPISLIVDPTTQTLEIEPNQDFRAPQILTSTTATINGQLGKRGDVDSFQVALQQGQTLVTWVEAYVLAAECDAMLRVLDARGTTLAFNHDHITIDPHLVFSAPATGNYIVQIMGHKYPASSEIDFTGGDDCVYRLHLTTQPQVRNLWPLCAPRQAKTQALLEGWNLLAPQMEIDPAAPPSFPVTFSDLPELVETKEPTTLAIPSAISGRIETPGAEDRYAFTAVKGAALEFQISGPTYGSLIDPVLRILNPEGASVANNDDGPNTRESRLVWTPPNDGTFTAAVSDLTQHGGQEYFYRLAITSPTPSVNATSAAHSIKLEAGKSADLKVTVNITNGFKTKLQLAATNLPPGVSATAVEVPEKGGEMKISLTMDATAPRADAPFQLVLREPGSSEGEVDQAPLTQPVEFSLVSSQEDNGVPKGYLQLLINRTPQLWLTAIPAPPPAPASPTPPDKPAQ